MSGTNSKMGRVKGNCPQRSSGVLERSLPKIVRAYSKRTVITENSLFCQVLKFVLGAKPPIKGWS